MACCSVLFLIGARFPEHFKRAISQPRLALRVKKNATRTGSQDLLYYKASTMHPRVTLMGTICCLFIAFQVSQAPRMSCTYPRMRSCAARRHFQHVATSRRTKAESLPGRASSLPWVMWQDARIRVLFVFWVVQQFKFGSTGHG